MSDIINFMNIWNAIIAVVQGWTSMGILVGVMVFWIAVTILVAIHSLGTRNLVFRLDTMLSEFLSTQPNVTRKSNKPGPSNKFKSRKRNA